MPKPVKSLSRHTGWQNVYLLRPEFARSGYLAQSLLGCLDAPTVIAGGPLQVDDYSTMRWASERGVFREALK